MTILFLKGARPFPTDKRVPVKCTQALCLRGTSSLCVYEEQINHISGAPASSASRTRQGPIDLNQDEGLYFWKYQQSLCLLRTMHRQRYSWNMLKKPSIILLWWRTELTIYRVLEHHPHPNVIDIIEINHDEGCYLHKYQTYSDIAETPTQAMRILWYRDILRALVRLRPWYHHTDLTRW